MSADVVKFYRTESGHFYPCSNFIVTATEPTAWSTQSEMLAILILRFLNVKRVLVAVIFVFLFILFTQLDLFIEKVILLLIKTILRMK